MVWSVVLVTAALAEPTSFVTRVDPPVAVGVDGRHGRPFLDQDGRWHLGHGRSGRFHDVILGDDLRAEIETARIVIDGDGLFVDHALAACPDGTYLHTASGNLEVPDDTAWATLLGPDLEAGVTLPLVERDPEMSTNDMAALCTEDQRLVAFAGYGDPELEIPNRNWLYRVTDAVLAGAEPERVPLHEAPRINGTSLVWDDPSQQLLVLGMPGGSSLQVAAYDAALEPVARQSVTLDMPAGVQAYWSAAAAAVGDGYVLVHMGRAREQGFAQDTGDVFLTVMDRSLFFVQTVRLTNLEPPNGAMRPGLAVQGDELLVVWDQEGRFSATRVQLDLSALAAVAEPVPQDTGQPPDTPPGGSGSGTQTATSATEPGGGCATVPGPPLGSLGLLLLALVRRRPCEC